MLESEVKRLAGEAGFELVGIAQAAPAEDFERYRAWVAAGMAGEMGYLTDHRMEARGDPRGLLAGARSVITVGKLYRRPGPGWDEEGRVRISCYARGQDYHRVVRAGLRRLARELGRLGSFAWRAVVDTAPLLERSYGRRAGLGWIGRNTCLINQRMGSWFFLGALVTSLELEEDAPPPDRCGSCRRCVEACPTRAIGELAGGWAVDSRKCISYLTIELRGSVREDLRPALGGHVFGCDICQRVCPWNRRAPDSRDASFDPAGEAPRLEEAAGMTAEEFAGRFGGSPVRRVGHAGFLRNVAVAMGSLRAVRFRVPLEALARSPNPLVAEHAEWALRQLE